ncbi:MAG: HAMP domain-containing protein [Spirochaetes bacterium]|nr:HAMP domain-containing protein [Spirochaetota bacterium]
MNINNLKIRSKILLGSSLLIIITLVLGTLSYIYIGSLTNTLTDITDNKAIAVEYATGVERMALSTIMEEKNYLLKGTDEVNQRIEGYLKTLKSFLDKIDVLAAEYNNSELLDHSKKARKDTEAYEAKYSEVVNLLKENKKLVAEMDEKGKTAIGIAAKISGMQINSYNSSGTTGAGVKNLDADVQRYIAATDIYEYTLKIIQAEKEEIYNRDRSAYKEMQALFPELMRSYEKLTEITVNTGNLRMITEAKGAIGKYKEAAAGWIINDDKLKVVLSDMDKLGMDVIKQARDSEAAGYKQMEAAKTDARALSSRAGIIIIAAIIASIIFGIIVALVLASIITGPIIKGVEFAKTLAEGDLTAMLNIKQKDEIGTLAGALNEMVENLRDIVGNITTSSNNVTSAADQVSQASQSLSQGTTEQASSLEEISSSLNEINSQSKQNADNATEANALAKTSAENADSGNRKMQELVAAMGKINESSEDIKKVVKVIDDIAFQINLLALNANVEAARAGKYGKGFAVVAEEVRNLAVRSADAVKETARMVDETTRNVEDGTKAAEATAGQLEGIVTGSSKVADFLGEIALASKEQAQGVEQINSGVEQIDQVTQANTASAEESAAAAEELASQALQLKGLISHFKLSNSGNGRSGFRDMQSKALTGEGKPVEIGREEGGRGTGIVQPAVNAVNGGTDKGFVDPKQMIKLDDDDFDRF